MRPKKLLDFKNCSKCKDSCCVLEKGYENCSPVFIKEEIFKIGIYKNKLKWRKFGKAFRAKLIDVRDKKKVICPFFDEERSSCSIEERKPLDCILFPFGFMKNKKRKAINLVYYNSKYCSGLKDISEEKLNNYKKYLTNFCRSLERNNILDISMDFDSEATFVKEILKI